MTSDIKIRPISLEKDKQEIGGWEQTFKGTGLYDSIWHFIQEDNTYHSLGELISINYEQFPIGIDERKMLFIAEKNKEIVGFVMFQSLYMSTSHPEVFLQYVVVKPGKQHQGIGEYMMTEMFLNPIKYFKIKPVEVFSIIDKTNIASQKLYTKFGFRFDGNQDPKYYLSKGNFVALQNSARTLAYQSTR